MSVMLKEDHKCIITIVKKSLAKKVIQATKSVGAEGGTVIFGKGIGIHEKKSFLGIPIEHEKEVIITLVEETLLETVIYEITRAAQLNKPQTGMGVVIDVSKIGGVAHRFGDKVEHVSRKGEDNAMTDKEVQYDLIVTIVNKGDADKVVDASTAAGAEGGTIINGRGTGIHENAKLFTIPIEPEKDIVLTLINRKQTDRVMKRIMVDAELNKPGEGVAFVLDVERTIGINHVLNDMMKDEFDNRA
ncbi:P-II family nitrogen regulator [Texcoconibacillus texcoconensis]|uniref:Nitrogen regulatory protein PII n=1 Tax=Texcoconibacillus texcoconensis TaxID=1095777 RepID=A0A840QRS3_9BACI|nr:P-II family nitrogen regulator [Texcoconibacillus texcoconensis]MBB5174011.1 nitrogen regulatory protein PII [Texcoconibacillus texcoconensis]